MGYNHVVMWRNILRRVLTAIAAVFVLIFYLNIEKLVEQIGWDQILVNGWTGVAEGLPWWVLPGLLFFVGAALALWVNELLPKKEKPTKTTNVIVAGLHVCEMRFTFADLKKDRHSEWTMRVFNGTGSVVEFSNLLGQVKFNAPNNTNPDCMGTLPTPVLRPDITRTISQLQECVVILTQRVPANEADKLLTMLADDIPIHFDLRNLTIEVVGQHDRNRAERLPIWDGVCYSRGNGFDRMIYLQAASPCL